MAQVRFLTGLFFKVDGEAIEDFEALSAGTISQLPVVVGNGNVQFNAGLFFNRQ